MDLSTITKQDTEVQAQTKVCFKCGKIKAIDDFYEHPQMADGHLNKCKECARKDVSLNYRDKIVYYKNYEKERNEVRWAYKTEQSKTWRRKNPEKYQAQCKLNNAVRSGTVKKQPCFICGDKNVHGHHYDYSKPLSVIWLCPQHHKWMEKKHK